MKKYSSSHFSRTFFFALPSLPLWVSITLSLPCHFLLPLLLPCNFTFQTSWRVQFHRAVYHPPITSAKTFPQSTEPHKVPLHHTFFSSPLDPKQTSGGCARISTDPALNEVFIIWLDDLWVLDVAGGRKTGQAGKQLCRRGCEKGKRSCLVMLWKSVDRFRVFFFYEPHRHAERKNNVS